MKIAAALVALVATVAAPLASAALPGPLPPIICTPAQTLIAGNLTVTSTIKRTSVTGGTRIVQSIKVKNNSPSTVSGLTLASPYETANTLIKGRAKAPGSQTVTLSAGTFSIFNVVFSGTTTLSIPSGKTLKATIAWKAIRCPPTPSPRNYEFGPAIVVIGVAGTDICHKPSSTTPTTVSVTARKTC